MSKDAAKIFANEWYYGGNEIGDYQIFWLTLLRDVFGVDKPERFITFQKSVNGKHIDAYIARTKVLIEHKSFGEDLSKKFLQSDGELLTPFEQAMRYADMLPANEKPRWIVTCNFAEFRICDLRKNLFEHTATIIKLRDLRYKFQRLQFLIDPTADDRPPEEKISKDAAQIIEKICLAFDKDYRKREPKFRDALSKFCTRLVFCFYADDSDIFKANKFNDYLQKFSPEELHDALQNFFDVLNTPDNLRGNINPALKNFPYVNGGLFDEKLDIPPLNENLKLTIERAHVRTLKLNEDGGFIKFSWHEIDPPIFGAMFESVVSSQREGGMYYTSVDNIHKVIDPLFLDDLHEEFVAAKNKRLKNRPQALFALQDKLAALKFLDPACGSGNFLTETYLSLRRLENEILEELRGLNVPLPDKLIKVSIAQFYGIEIEPFAVAVAQTALWIAENQMLQETEGALGKNLQALPLKNYATIICANALQIDWSSVAPEVDYIIGNPPFRGYSEQTPEQKADMRRVFADNNKAGKMDYVAAWYRKAAEFIQGTAIRCGFVSTNSIVQGEQCAYLWKSLYERLNIHIDFAHRTFKWLSDSDNMAHVHCVVVGFSRAPNPKPKKIFVGGKFTVVDNINAYLVDGEDIFVESHNEHYQPGVLKIKKGSQPTDGGNLVIKAEDLEDFIKLEPSAQKYVYLYLGAEEFINGKKRYCLWLKDCPLNEIKKMPLVDERVEACRQSRLQSKKVATRKSAKMPQLFQEIRQPTTNYLLLPSISSERRRYIPIGFMPPNVIASNLTLTIPNATLYHFGVLTSSIHMAWLRTVGGRFKSDYIYSASIVYNNFPWCEVTARQRRMIERSAQDILNVRADFPDWTFAALYNEDTMPDELRHAHKSNDYAVALAYGFESFWEDESRIVAELMKLYRRLTDS